jgi:hypothetical protein
MEIRTPEDLVQLEERIAYLAKAERPDLALLRSRPYVQFRNGVLAHLQHPGSSVLRPNDTVKFRHANVSLCVMEIGDRVRVWTGITEPLVDI